VRKSLLTLSCRGRNRAMPKSRGKLVHLGGRSAMSCDLLALDKFLSGPYTSRKYVVMLGHAVMVGKLWE
jgi:hypothetical protein